MPSLNFKKQFAADVEGGVKRQTIRAWRKRPFEAGDMLYLFVGMRRPGCKRLGQAICTFADSIEIDEDEDMNPIIRIGELPLTTLDRDQVAQLDGFADVCGLLDFFQAEHGLPFRGQIIRW